LRTGPDLEACIIKGKPAAPRKRATPEDHPPENNRRIDLRQSSGRTNEILGKSMAD